jgi:hypothetical protein
LIGVFDSGIGGLSVYRQIRRLLPDASTVYLADQGFGMYGDRTLDEVARVADGGGSGTVRFITTGDEDRFSDQLERLGLR